MAALELEMDLRRSAPAEPLMSFLCPVCEQRLNVPSSLARVVGPCPSCQRMIRAPQFPLNPTSGELGGLGVFGMDSEIGADDRAGDEPDAALERSVAALRPMTSFCATKRIAPPSAEGLDDSWRKKVERSRKQSRRRRRRHRWLKNSLVRAAAFRRLGILVLLGILALTIGLLYLNHRSGGQLLGGGFGH